MTKRAFVSYVRSDTEVVTRLCADLEAAGIQLWLDRNNLLPGQRWQIAIRRAIRDGSFFLACFSRESLAKQRTYMNEELLLAIEELRQRSTQQAWFIPILLSPVELPDLTVGGGHTLRDIQHVALYEDWDVGIKQLLSVLRSSPDTETAERRLTEVTRKRLAVLAAALASEEVPDEAETELRAYGVAALPELVNALMRPDGEVNWRIARLIRDIGLPAKSAGAALADAMRSLLRGDQYDEWSWKYTLEAIGAIGDEHGIDVLLEVLHRRRLGLSTEAALETAVLAIGSRTVLRLRQVVTAGVSLPAVRAARYLLLMDRAANSDVLPVIIAGLEYSEAAEEAARALATLSEISQMALPSLRKVLDSTDIGVRLQAVRAIGRIGATFAVDDGIIARLKEIHDKDWRLSSILPVAASEALFRIRARK